MSFLLFHSHVFFWKTRGNKAGFVTFRTSRGMSLVQLGTLGKVQNTGRSHFCLLKLDCVWHFHLCAHTHIIFCLLKGAEESLVLPTHPCFRHNEDEFRGWSLHSELFFWRPHSLPDKISAHQYKIMVWKTWGTNLNTSFCFLSSIT